MSLMDFFDFSKKFTKIYVQGSQTNGYRVADPDDFDQIQPRQIKDQSYAEEYRLKERQELENPTEFVPDEEPCSSRFSDVETASAGAFQDVNELKDVSRIYETYCQKKPKPNPHLTINDYHKNIVSMIELNEVTIITGPTGCGKTTQVPQYILDSHAAKGLPCNIVVTQPRRIAAISIARRVCEERDWPIGSLCGYKVGLKEEISEDTRLTYMTVGVFLQFLISQKNMTKFTHVILDEVHERDQSMDFALLVIKKLLNTNSRFVKVILMSATVDAAKFASYFQKFFLGSLHSAPVIEVKKALSYAVQIHYLEELAQLGELPDILYEEPNISPVAYQICINLIKQFERIDTDTKHKKSVLVFLPGIFEIEELYNRLKDPKVHSPDDTHQYKWHPLPLHSSITFEEQRRAFQPPPTGHRKIILATNIAESSITVPDVKFVIDFCLTKILKQEINSTFSSLQLSWASIANCKQRAGRVGRVMDGRVYRMVYKSMYQNLDEECVPEMLRCSLDKVVLQTKLLNMGEPKSLLALALDPPDLSNIESTILILKELGGLLLTAKGVPTPYDGDITFMGRLMALMPVDIHITRLIVMGHIFSCLSECLIMGAALSLKSVFSSPFQSRLKAYNSKLDWADGSCSDCIAFLNVYEVWMRNHRDGYFKRSVGDGEVAWAKRHFIQLNSLKEVKLLVEDLQRRCNSNSIEEPFGHNKVEWDVCQKALILKLVIAGAFYPNYFGRCGGGGQVDEQNAVKVLGGRDPFNTVYLQNFPTEQPSDLYSQLIQEELADCKHEMDITYDGSCKVYIQFRNSLKEEDDEHKHAPIPGKISMAVYRAVKLRQIKRSISIRVLPVRDAQKLAEKLGIGERKSLMPDISVEEPYCSALLPSVDIATIDLKIMMVADPGHFWAMYGDRRSLMFQKKICELLNDSDSTLQPLKDPPKIGDTYAAPYSDETGFLYYRVRVEKVVEKDDGTNVLISFMDFGNTDWVRVGVLRLMNPEVSHYLSKIPPLAFECVLTGIRPSMISSPNGVWTDDALQTFEDVVKKPRVSLIGKVYSVVKGVVSLELFCKEQRGKQINMNEYLIETGWAERVEESYLSKSNHEIRQLTQLNQDQLQAYNQLQKRDVSFGKFCQPPDKRDCKVTLDLRGPHSPLEMRVFSYMRGEVSKSISVSQDSVNSVLLDTDPQDPRERLIVAGHVSQNNAGSTLVLHHVTLMPNIPGLASLIPFIFAPTIELRLNEAGTRYVGLLCGLGTDQTGKAMFPEHDMAIVFDSEFSFEDFTMINRLRYHMSMMLDIEDDETVPRFGSGDILKCQRGVKECLLELLGKKRTIVEPVYTSKHHKWGLVKSNLVVDNSTVANLSKRFIFKFHPGVELKEVEETEEKAEQAAAAAVVPPVERLLPGPGYGIAERVRFFPTVRGVPK